LWEPEYLSGANQAALVVETRVSIWNKPSSIRGGNQSIYLEEILWIPLLMQLGLLQIDTLVSTTNTAWFVPDR
jgi:hypothetical protein